MNAFDRAKDIADTVLYEGYLLFPYTASAKKNKMRFQFGVLVPSDYAARGTGEHASLRAEMIARGDDSLRVTARVRFLQIQSRTVEAYDSRAQRFVPADSLRVGAEEYVPWDEAVPQEVDVVADFERPEPVASIEFPLSTETTEVFDATGNLRGRISRQRWPLHGVVELRVVPVAPGRARVEVNVQNESAVTDESDRNAALRTSFISTHIVLSVESGTFLSLLDPPDEDASLVRACVNERVFPVLVGDAKAGPHAAPLALASPIILYDFPGVAEQSRRSMFDGTEIDELLHLSVLSLSEDERREARATDPAARDIVDRSERLDAARIDELHGIMTIGEPEPGSESVVIDGVRVQTGSRVILRPKRRADVWDSFVDGKEAHVSGVYRDMENNVHVAVTVDDDPASEFHQWYGRALFFGCDEVEPLQKAHR